MGGSSKKQHGGSKNLVAMVMDRSTTSCGQPWQRALVAARSSPHAVAVFGLSRRRVCKDHPLAVAPREKNGQHPMPLVAPLMVVVQNGKKEGSTTDYGCCRKREEKEHILMGAGGRLKEREERRYG